jgi:hypothetical protein
LKAIVSNVDSLEVYIAKHCLMFTPVFSATIVRTICEAYREFVDAGYLFDTGEYIPSALSIFAHEIESYRSHHSPIMDLMCDCIEERMFESDGVERDLSRIDGEEDVAMNILHATWTESQRDVVHDMELVMQKLQLVFLRHDKQIINSPIKEVW